SPDHPYLHSFPTRRSSDLPSIRLGSNFPCSNALLGALRDIDFRSAPAQNAPPAPVRTQLRIESSLSTRSQASTMIAIISPLIARSEEHTSEPSHSQISYAV